VCAERLDICLFAIGVWLIMTFVGFCTSFGRYMYIIGGGEAVATTAGLSARRHKIYGFALSGMMAGLAGAPAVARQGAAGPTLGKDLLLNTLAAIVVGGMSLSGSIGGVHRTLICVLSRQWCQPDGRQRRRPEGFVVVAVLIGQDPRQAIRHRVIHTLGQ